MGPVPRGQRGDGVAGAVVIVAVVVLVLPALFLAGGLVVAELLRQMLQRD